MARYLAAHSERCSGCKTCQLICTLVHFKENNPKKGALIIKPNLPEPGFQVITCTQCGECANVCPTGAIYEENGVYKIDKEKCVGCYVCVDACPENAMVKHPAETAPIKCDLCGECVNYCGTKALYITEG
ncbi:MAG: 4Fe-4S dicluster domain-containing protein [Synergistetes bacterium]|nr:4Fe-4S dicluster domain-containing protein [Synergistota bacterium]